MGKMIKEFSLKKDGELKLSNNFKVREFACKDGSDKILIDLDLVEKLQKLRDYMGISINVLSGYRTESYNLKINNSTTSKHCMGMACDIYIKSSDKDIQYKYSKIMALWSEFNGLGGVGLYTNRNNEPFSFVHIDTRTAKYRWFNDGGNQVGIDNILDKVGI